MGVWFDRFGGFVLDVSVSAAALLGVVAIAMILCQQPVRRLLLARGALLGLLALIPLVGFRLVPRFDVVSAIRESGLVPKAGVIADGDAFAPPLDLFGRATRATTLVYVSVVAVGLARLALGLLGLTWLTGRSSDPSPEARTLYESLPVAPGCQRPRLRVVERVRRPVLIGWLRPTILLPPALDQPAALGQLRLGLLHELAHAEAADSWFGLAGNLAQVFCFFLPPVWWIGAQMRLDQEFLADRRAATGFGPLREYASSLLGFASPRADGVESAEPGTALESQRSALFQRVLMLVRCPFPVEQRPPVWWSSALPFLAVFITLGAASLSVRSPARAFSMRATPRTNTFQVATLTVAAVPAGPHGRAPLFELPIRLPAEFDLTVEVSGDRSTLAQSRVVGLSLESPALAAVLGGTADRASWHVVRVRRDRDGVSLWIDGRPGLSDRETPTLTAWLSVEPAPDREGVFRRLVLSWESP